jgi:hypothetical protein
MASSGIEIGDQRFCRSRQVDDLATERGNRGGSGVRPRHQPGRKTKGALMPVP